MTKEEIDIKVVEFDCGDPSSQQFCKAEGVKSYPHIKMYDIEYEMIIKKYEMIPISALTRPRHVFPSPF